MTLSLISPSMTFQSTHPLRGATLADRLMGGVINISIHAPLAGCDKSASLPSTACRNFNPRTPCGVRRAWSRSLSRSISFQSTHPLRGATCAPFAAGTRSWRFQSTHPLRGATRYDPSAILQAIISIHAPLAGCDTACAVFATLGGHFNPRTPCGVRPRPNGGIHSNSYFNPRTPCGVRRLCAMRRSARSRFQSTHPLRGATCYSYTVYTRAANFNPRTPCGVRPRSPSIRYISPPISIHAPLAGCDFGVRRHGHGRLADFNPRTPCGVRRRDERGQLWAVGFQSTHPLRGATVGSQITHTVSGEFQSTHPLRGATIHIIACAVSGVISIHAPLAGCDQTITGVIGAAGDFNPRTPCGVRPVRRGGQPQLKAFQSTHPLRGATSPAEAAPYAPAISIHAPLAGCDSASAIRFRAAYAFQSTHPLRGATKPRIIALAADGISIHAPLAGCDVSTNSSMNSALSFQSTHPLRGAT